jgi:hypothetical protein
MLPTFLVIGAMKGGTTSLYEYLRAHPQVFMTEQKEISFFSGHTWDRGLEWYESLFDRAGAAVARGEVSPAYTRYPGVDGVPERIAAALPDVRLVYVVRHPVERLVSHYRWAAHGYGERRPIDDAVLDHRRYLAVSMYAMQIERYLEHFERSQLLVVTSEALRREREATLRTVFDFIGVDPACTPPATDREFLRSADLRADRAVAARFRGTAVHRVAARAVPAGVRSVVRRLATRPSAMATMPATLRPETEAAVVERLRPDLERLPRYLGADFDCWGLLTPGRAG